MDVNWQILFLSALIPVIIAWAWYSPKTFGNIWMRSAEVPDKKKSTKKLVLILGLTYLMGLFISTSLATMVIHQFGIFGTLGGQPGLGQSGSDVQFFLDDYIYRFGNSHRNFKHGALHGGYVAISFVLPIIVILSLFENKGWKYIAVHFGYWFLSLLTMGGLICHFM